jgi:hypothetical protein
VQQFIPFEDDWDALENLRPEDLIPYRIEFLDDVPYSTSPTSPAMFSSSPTFKPMRAAVPADNSRT